MRVGQNPVKAVESIAPPAPVTVVVITYIPFLSGYYAQGLEVLQRCLESLWAHTEGDYDLMLFDNASCGQVRDYLLAGQVSGKIQYLTLSERNLGKAGAWNLALAAAPGEIVVYADADVYFHPGWLPAQIAALTAFPEAGMVTAMPLITPLENSAATVRWTEQQMDLALQRGAIFPWEELWRHARSVGMNETEARAFHAQHEAIRIQRQGTAFYVGAGHFQFAAPKAVLDEVLPIPSERPMGQVKLLDEAIDSAGYLRLCTADTYVEHMGNSLADKPLPAALPGRQRRRLPRLVTRLLQWLHDKSFQLLFKEH